MGVTFKAVDSWPTGAVVTIQNAKGEFLTIAPGTNKLVCADYVSHAQLGSEWTLRKHDGHAYQIWHALSGTCLDVCEESRKDGAAVMLYAPTGHKNQLWELSKAKGGHYYIRAAHSHKCLDMIDGKPDRIGQWVLWGGPNQLWKVKVVGTDTSSDSDSD